MNKLLIFFCFALTLPCAPLLLAQTAANTATRPTCAVLTFDALEGITHGEARLLSDRFVVELDRHGVYRITSRSKMDDVLQLQAFSRSENCSATECAIEAGKLLSVEHIIYGSVGKIGTLYSLNAYVASVESGETVKSATVDQPGGVEKTLTMGVGALARRLLGKDAANGGSGTDDLAAEMRAKEKEDEQKRLDAERTEARKRLAEELRRRKAEFDKDYAAYLKAAQSEQRDDGMKRNAWKAITTAWGVKDAGAEPRGLEWDDATGMIAARGFGIPENFRLTVDVGNGVKLEFVWIIDVDAWVGKYEVTNEEYREFKKDHDSGERRGRSLNGDRQPAAHVSYNDAVAYAEWVNGTARLPEGYKCRLPDGNEWMTFAQCRDGRRYPWGNEWPPKWGNYADSAAKGAFASWTVIDGHNDGADVTCRVEKSGKNDWGLCGVGGNVWEWTSELHETWRVLRGASWSDSSQDNLECACRINSGPSDRNSSVGFRLVLFH